MDLVMVQPLEQLPVGGGAGRDGCVDEPLLHVRPNAVSSIIFQADNRYDQSTVGSTIAAILFH